MSINKYIGFDPAIGWKEENIELYEFSITDFNHVNCRSSWDGSNIIGEAEELALLNDGNSSNKLTKEEMDRLSESITKYYNEPILTPTQIKKRLFQQLQRLKEEPKRFYGNTDQPPRKYIFGKMKPKRRAFLW